MEASLRILTYIILCTTCVLSLANKREEQWVCEVGEKYCVYKPSKPKNWFDASERCIALGGRLPFWIGFEDTSLTDEAKGTSWSDLHWYAGRWHEFKAQSNAIPEFQTYSPAFLRNLVVKDAVLRHIARGEHCFAISLNSSDVSEGISKTSSPFKALGHKCNTELPFLCITGQARFSETQRKLKLPLKQVNDIRFQKIAGSDPGTEALRCVPKFQNAYDNLKDRPFNIVWILDDAYFPEEITKPGDQNTTIVVPYKNFTKYACEVRYLGSIYGNRSHEIEVATPSRGKLGLLIRIRNATFSTSSLDYAQPIKELVNAINDEPRALNLSQVGSSSFEQNDSELFIVAYMLSDSFWRRELTDMIDYEEQIETLNAFLGGSYVKQDSPFQTSRTLEAIAYFESRIRNGTLVGVQFFAVDRCPLERSASFFWAGGVGTEVQPILTGDSPSETCLEEDNFPVTRTCRGSLFSGAQWVEPFSEGQNCSKPSSKSTGAFCREGYSQTTQAEEKGVYCVKQVPSRTWNDAMEACFGGVILSLSAQPILDQYDPTEWIHNTIDYLTRNNTSGALTGNLLWLPSRRRVRKGPLYPYMMSSDFEKPNNYSASNDWEVSLPGNADNATKTLSYEDLEDSECLAWSVKARTLTTRSCSERHPTVCIVRWNPDSSSDELEIPQQVSSYYIPECYGFDFIVVNTFGQHSCHKLVYVNELENFTWEEAQMQCKKYHTMSTLTEPTSIVFYRIQDFQDDSEGTWFGVRQSERRSNNSCRLVTSTNQCIDPIFVFSNDTDFLHGVYVSTSGNGRNSWKLRLPETRLSQAVCQVNFQLASLLAETPVTYHLNLVWENSTGNILKLYLTREGRLLNGSDWEKILEHEWQFIRLKLVCFGDGLLLDVSDVPNHEVKEMYLEFPSHVVSFYCESRTRTAIFLRSNSVLWRKARLTFVVTGRAERFRIVPSVNETRDTAGVTIMAKSEFAEMYELSKISNKYRYSSSKDVKIRVDNAPSKTRNYTVLNCKHSRVGVDSKNYEEYLLRCHVVCYNAADNLTAALMQLREDISKARLLNFLRDWTSFRDSPEPFRSIVTCLEEVEERPFGNLTWIETALDRTAFSREGCVFEGGSLVQRACIGDIYYGAYWGTTKALNAEGRLVNLSSEFICASRSETTSRLLNITETRQNATSALAELQRVTRQWEPIIADVQLTALIFSNASREETKFSQMNVKQTASIIQQVLKVDTNTLANAQRLPNVSTNLLMGIEGILTSTNASKSTVMAPAQHGFQGNTAELTGSKPFLFTANSFNLGELNDTVANTSIIRSTSPDVTDNLDHDALVLLDVSSLTVNRINASQIAFVYHPNIRLADAGVAAGKTYAKVYSLNPSDGDHDMLRTANYTANSAMVQVTVGGRPVYNLSEPVQIYFRPFRAVNTTNSTNSIVCAFWNPVVNNGHGGWSTQGCWYQGNVGGLDHCQCNHLSSFTSFFAYDYYESTIHDSILDTLTKIGCALSLLGCVGVMATYTIFPKWRQPKPGYYGNHVIFQLSLALALLLSTFLGGFDQTGNGRVCLFVAAFLHYLMLVVFFWMLVEAYCHYLLFVRVMGSLPTNFMLPASLFAWLLPLVPVIALLVWDTELYYYKDGNKFCWLTPPGFYYALLPFASLIGLINLALYIIIIVKVGCAKPTIRSTRTKRSFTHYTAVVIFFVMGLSWVFGLLAIGHARTVFSYLFCIFNSLQGFAIFLHFIFRGERAHEQWQNFIDGKSDREKARDRLLDQAKHSKPSATSTGGATSEIVVSKSTSSTPSRVIGELKSRQRLQKHSEYETSKL